MSFDLKALRAQAAEVCGQPAHPNKPTYSVAEHKKRLEQKAKEKTQAKKALKKTAESFLKRAAEVRPGWYDNAREARGLFRDEPVRGVAYRNLSDHVSGSGGTPIYEKQPISPLRATRGALLTGAAAYGAYRLLRRRKKEQVKTAEEVMPGWFDRRHEAAGLLRKPPKSGTMRPRMADVHGDPKFKQQVWRKAAYDPKRVAGASAAVIAAGVTGYGLHRWRKARKAMEARRDPDGIEARRSTHTEKLDGRFD